MVIDAAGAAKNETESTMQNVIQTERTYKTYTNAVNALINAVGPIEAAEGAGIRYGVGSKLVNGEVRFAPFVMIDRNRPELIGLAHRGITVLG